MTMTIRNDHAMSGSTAHARMAAGVAVPLSRRVASQGGTGGIGHCTGFNPTDNQKRSRSLAAGGDP
jgi:hypothetical protein